ncbi:MAG: hypothetical protein JKX73_08615, partial [Flavobacteriales bacterium]|nr:hypothetical protein [Flavobacteriales bacterium]
EILTQAPQNIEKEEVSELTFPRGDVIGTTAKRVSRSSKVLQAMRLGNLSHFKVKIIFEDDQDVKVVNTTIWSVTEKMLVLKAGIMIPVHRVHSVKFL